MKIDRLISIIMILLERKKASLAELSDICEVTPRTIQRDLDAINQAGIPIVSYPGVRGGVGIMENYKLEKRLFSTSDITALLMGLGSIRSSLTGDAVVSALAKVKGIIPEEQRAQIEWRARQITIDTTPWLGANSQDDLIAMIQTAMDYHQLLRFEYTDRRMNKSVRTVEPHRLVLKGMRWYLDAWCMEREDFRLFKLTRMNATEILDTSFEPRAHPSGGQVEPRFHDADLQIATLRVREAALDSLSDLVDINEVEKDGEGAWLVSVPVPVNDHGCKFLLGMGVDCECLTPPELRHQLQEYLRQISDIYV